MAIKYPILLILVLIITVIYLIYSKKNSKNTFDDGYKIANTKYIKESPYFKKKVKTYNMIVYTMYLFFFISIISLSILLSRIVKVERINTNIYTRDIMLCMDVSKSVDDLNMELVKNYKNTLDSFKGERIGITIFNTSSVVLVPLTEDYDYVKDILDKLYESIEVYNDDSKNYENTPNYSYIKNYILNGTIYQNETRGSSLIGDGLATCVYNFPKLEEDRTRVIILSTDNDVAGEELVTLSQAASISKSKNIKVYGISTKFMYEKDNTSFKQAVLKTGGKYYPNGDDIVKSIINDIETTTKASKMENIVTKENDLPTIPLILFIISFAAIIFIDKKVLK